MKGWFYMPELNEQTQGQQEVVTETPKTYTQQEVDELLQKEADRRVSEALKKAEKKNAEKLREAQRLSQMNEQQKYEYELQQREAAIAEKERQLTLAENKNICSKMLAEKGIDLALVDFCVAEDAETMNNNIKLLDNAFKKSVRVEVEKRLGSNTPRTNTIPEGTITKEAFNKMTLMQKQELYSTNRELYDSLTK